MGAFTNCNNLISVGLPANLTTIGAGVFGNCTSLSEIELPISITNIATKAFYNCTSLEFDELNLPNLTSLGANAFYGVKIKKLNLGTLAALPTSTTTSINYGDKAVLEEVLIPNVSQLTQYSFYQYTALKKVDISNATFVGDNVFMGCTSLNDVGDISGITSMYGNSFRNCTSLTFAGKVFSSLTTMNGTVGSGCFYGSGITEFNAPNLESLADTNVTYLGHFQNSALERVISLGKITRIPMGNSNYGVFKNCSSLTSVNLPDTLTHIGSYAFHQCPAITTFNYDWSKLVSIGLNVFAGPTFSVDEMNLNNLESFEANSFYSLNIKKIIFGKISGFPDFNSNNQPFGNRNALEEVVLPTTLTTLGSYGFYGYTSLHTINLDNITTVTGTSQFQNCTSLTGDIYSPMNRVGDSMFRYTAITSFRGPNVTVIDSSAFSYCSQLTLARFGSLVTTIDEYAFRNASLLESVIIESITPPELNSTAFNGTTCIIYVPDESLEAYRAATNWSAFADRIKPLSEYIE